MAARLSEPSERYMGFVGKSLHSFRKARALGSTCCELVAANSHVENVRRLHERACRDTQIDDRWLNRAQRRKTLAEYACADRIYVHSNYTEQSFLDAGVPASRLRRTVLTVAPRFQPPARRPDDGVFRVVYVGRVEATKGIPLLMEAFRTMPLDAAELILVGGWSTRAMRLYIERCMAQDDRISVAPGDPLPTLQRADVFVHPSYEDGFGYAPMEALACGVPAIVTEDTGMKEYVADGENGYIVPTGSVHALVERLEAVHCAPLATTRSFLPARLVGGGAAGGGAVGGGAAGGGVVGGGASVPASAAH
jgi:glycosyltransferase involved in cell wall biosynthesis